MKLKVSLNNTSKKEEVEESNPENFTDNLWDLSLDRESFTRDSGYANDEEKDASNDEFAKLSSSWQFQYEYTSIIVNCLK